MPKIQCGLIYDFRNPDAWQQPWAQHYRGLLDQATTAERLGFDQIWLTEHHFAPDGYLPALFPVAAALAVETERIRIGTNALLAALHHPLRVAEDAAVVDILSGGRLDLGLTLGFRAEEFLEFGLSPSLANRVRRLKRVAKTLREAYVSAHGRARLSPPPIQRPHPPIYIGANAPAALRALAPLGAPLILVGGPEKLELYRQAQIAAGFEPAQVGPPVQSLGMFLFVGGDTGVAWETVGPHARYAVEQDLVWSGRSAAVSEADVQRRGLFGTPDEIAAQIVIRVAKTRPAQICFFANPPGMNPTVAAESLRLFAQEVRPRIDAALAEG